jgi:hypothetical protein
VVEEVVVGREATAHLRRRRSRSKGYARPSRASRSRVADARPLQLVTCPKVFNARRSLF